MPESEVRTMAVNGISVNVSLKDTKIFKELVAALKFIIRDERIDESIRQEYLARLDEHIVIND